MPHEIALQSRKSKNKIYTEILAFMEEGKVYLGDPGKRLPIAAQKGSVCWYYALNRIRIHYGKNYRNNADRHVEKIVSAYRKSLTAAELVTSQMKIIMKNPPMGISLNFKLSELDKLIKEPLSTPKDSTSMEKGLNLMGDRSLFLQLDLICMEMGIAILSNDESGIKKCNEKLIETLTKDLFVIDKVKKINTVTVSFQESLYYFTLLSQMVKEKNNQQLTTYNNRLGIAYLVLIKNIERIIDKDLGALNLEEVIEYIHALWNAESIQNLYKNLDIKAEQSFFDEMLTTGVYNSLMHKTAKSLSKTLTNALNNHSLTDSTKTITFEVTETLKSYYNLANNYAYNRIIELYDLHKSTWTPKQGFTGLTEAINKDGALVIRGNCVGLPAYNAPAKTLMKGNKPATIGSRMIKYWSRNALKSISSDETEADHAIIVIGTQSIIKKTSGYSFFLDSKEKEKQIKQYLLFLDPNDASKPNEERIVYRMKYSDFITRISLQNGCKITNPQVEPDNGFYAIAAPKR